MSDAQTSTVSFDASQVRADFPTLQQTVNGKPLVYLDNAATAQKPRQVIERLTRFYEQENANIHRGVHHLSQVATGAYEAARQTVARFIGAPSARGCVFTRGATEAVNLVASSWGTANLKKGDEILISEMEHHANIVPWQLLVERVGVKLCVVPVLEDGSLDMDAFHQLLTPKVKLVAMCYASNALGTINPVAEIVAAAHANGALVLLDSAQAISHFPVNVGALDCDFFVFSGHKVFGPTGIGMLYGRPELLDAMPPYQGGGDMIERVRFEKTTYRKAPERFEAGTPNIAGAIGLAAAVDYLNQFEHGALFNWENQLLAHAMERVADIPGIRIYGTASAKVAVLSFIIEGVHPQDIGTMLDLDGIAVRTGHHCTMPLWERFGLEGTTRASFAFYNTMEEVEQFAESLSRIRKLFS